MTKNELTKGMAINEKRTKNPISIPIRDLANLNAIMDVRIRNRVVSTMLLFLISVVYAPFLLIALVLPQSWVLNSRFYFRLAQFFYWFVRKISFLNITIKGAEHIPQDPAIFVANHQSSFSRL